MSDSIIVMSKAERVRYLLSQWGATAIAPVLENAGNVLVPQDPENTVKASVLKDPNVSLNIVIAKWSDIAPSDQQDTLTVYHIIGSVAGTPPTEEILFQGTFNEDNEDQLPLSVSLPKFSEGYGDGNHGFKFVLRAYNMEVPFESDVLSLRFDRVAPNEGNVPPAVPDIAQIVDANVANVHLTLPDYPDRSAGDHVYYYWLKEVPKDLSNVPPAGNTEVVAANQLLPLPEAVIRAGGDGEFYAFYVLIDKAGNVGQISQPKLVSVALGAMPANLQAPVVPLAADDGKVDRADAALGVQVNVLTFDNWKPTDEVSASWQGKPLGRRDIGEGQTFPLVFTVSDQVLRETYGTPAEGDKDMAVRYEVWRGGTVVGFKEETVVVNFETFGPVDPGTDPDPEWPDLVNPRLPLPVVYGQGSTTPNVLLPEHDGKEASLEVLLYEGLLEDDLIEFYWNDEHVVEADYLIDAGDVAGDKLPRTIPWAYIKQAGNGTAKVHYQITRASVPNKPASPMQNVDVTAIVVHPDKPQFEGVDATDWLNCSSLKDPNDAAAAPAVRITVGDLTQYGLSAGDEVTLKWWVLHNQTGDVEVKDAALEDIVTLGPDYPATGFVWRVEPYEDHILPVYEFDPKVHNGRAFCTYEFADPALRGSGTRALIVSDPAEQRMAMHTPFGPCDF
ncbi:hypothetical protein [Pseudomonas sp.]|uniref:hypothetical protein n=1 Tax=Pseudomonas sp. TaxID=306 RepID=UPI0028AE5259|nr:hypothetical protein [Pseudomonas sp.]